KTLGADVRWASCNIYSTQDHAAAAVAASGTPVFAVKGETLRDYWDYQHRIFEWGDGGTPNMVLDDGGDATLLIHLGLRAEAGEAGLLAKPTNEEEEILFAAIKQRLRERPGWYKKNADAMRAGKVAMVAGFGDVGKGSAASLRQAGCRVLVSEVDPICALQAAMEGYEVTTMDDAAPRADIFVTATGNLDVITIEHMRRMKDRAIVANIGHFDSEIQVSALRNFKWYNVKPQVDEIEFPDGKRIILLSEGRLVNLGNAMGHPSFVMSSSFSNQTLAQIELWTNPKKYEKKVYTLPKHLDEKVARLHLAKIGAKLTKMSDRQAQYIGEAVEGPYKSDHYRY